MVIVGIGALKLLHHDVESTVSRWIQLLRVDPDNQLVHGLLSRLFAVSPKQLKEAGVGTFLYAAVFFTEGTGLWLGKRWAEYFTIISTAGLIPLEVYEIHRHSTAAKILVLAVNVAIVIYLAARLRAPGRNRR